MRDLRYCIHGRSENQKCRLCNYRSDCCDAPVEEYEYMRLSRETQAKGKPAYYVCEACRKVCKMVKK